MIAKKSSQVISQHETESPSIVSVELASPMINEEHIRYVVKYDDEVIYVLDSKNEYKRVAIFYGNHFKNTVLDMVDHLNTRVK